MTRLEAIAAMNAKHALLKREWFEERNRVCMEISGEPYSGVTVLPENADFKFERDTR